jgi:AraC-like DNA-binding protein
MAGTEFIRLTDFDLDEPITLEVVAERTGASRSLVARLVRQGLLEPLAIESNEPMLPRRAILQLRRMQRLRRDLRVNFTGAAIILELVGRIDQLNRELAAVHTSYED